MKGESFLVGVFRGVMWGFVAIIILVCGVYVYQEGHEHGHAKRKMSEKCDPYQECTQCRIDCSTWKIKRLQSR